MVLRLTVGATVTRLVNTGNLCLWLDNNIRIRLCKDVQFSLDAGSVR